MGNIHQIKGKCRSVLNTQASILITTYDFETDQYPHTTLLCVIAA